MWWNESYQNLVKEAWKAFRDWRESPLSLAKRMEWKKAEAKKGSSSRPRKDMHGQPSYKTWALKTNQR
jgi:hypothetical protein